MTEQERPRTEAQDRLFDMILSMDPKDAPAPAVLERLLDAALAEAEEAARTEGRQQAVTEQERPRTEAGRRLYRDTREGMTILQDAMRSRILAIEAEGRQQAVREIRDHNDYDKMPVRLRAHIDRVAGASESSNNNPGGEDHTLQVLPDDSFYCLKCQQVVPPDHSALDTNERPGPFDLAELTGTIEGAPIGHLQTALGGNGEPLALWIKRMYGQRLRVRDASESPLCPDCGNDMRYAGHPVPWRRCGDASESPPPDEWPYDRLPTPPDQLREAEVLARMRQAARVDACPDHDEKGAADEASGFPTCSKCGAILTGDASESGQPPEARS